MKTPEPDVAGYVDAQERLRARLGRDVPFFTPTPTVWPAGVPTDAEGVPLDPSVQPVASGFVSAVVRCSVVSRPVTGRIATPEIDSPIGIKDHSTMVLIMGKADYDEKKIAAATEAELFERRYKIEAREPDQIGPGPAQRVLIFVEKK